MSCGVPMLMGYDAYGNARDWREMMRLETTSQTVVKNKLINGVGYTQVSCCHCGKIRVTLYKIVGGYICRECQKECEVIECD